MRVVAVNAAKESSLAEDFESSEPEDGERWRRFSPSILMRVLA